MNVTHKPTTDDADTDVRRLLDAGYEVVFTATPVGYDPGTYMAIVTNSFGSHWRGVGATPAEALRSVWPLGYETGQGGCGHCGALGCIAPDCPICAVYGPVTPGHCGVCGRTWEGAR